MAAGVGGHNRDLVFDGRFEIDVSPLLDTDFVANDFKVAGRIRCKGIGKGLTRILVHRRECGHHRPFRRVFRDMGSGNIECGLRLVEVVDFDSEGLFVGVAIRISNSQGDVVMIRHLMIQVGTRLHPQLVTHDLEKTGLVIDDGIGEAFTSVHILCAQSSHHRSAGGIFVHIVIGKDDGVGRLVEAVDGDLQSIGIPVAGAACSIVYLNRQVERLLQRFAVVQRLNLSVGVIQFVFVGPIGIDGQGAVLPLYDRLPIHVGITTCHHGK